MECLKFFYFLFIFLLIELIRLLNDLKIILLHSNENIALYLRVLSNTVSYRYS